MLNYAFDVEFRLYSKLSITFLMYLTLPFNALIEMIFLNALIPSFTLKSVKDL